MGIWNRSLAAVMAVTWSLLGVAVAQEETSATGAVDLNLAMQAELEKQISVPPPETTDAQEKCVYLHGRGMAYYKLGRYEQAISDLKQALQLNQPNRITQNALCDRWRMQGDLSAALVASGDPFAQIEHLKEVSSEWKGKNSLVFYYSQLRLIVPHMTLGMHKEAEELFNSATSVLAELRARSYWGNMQNNIMDGYYRRSAQFQVQKGNYAEAEKYWRLATNHAKQWIEDSGRINGINSQHTQTSLENFSTDLRSLSSVLSAQGKIGESEHLAHEALKRTLSYSSVNTIAASNVLAALRGVKLQQGNLGDANRYAGLALLSAEKSTIQPFSTILAARRAQLGLIQVIREQWQDAIRTYDARDKGLRSNPEQFAKVRSDNIDWALALLRTKQSGIATEMLRRTLEDESKQHFKDPYYVAHIRGYLGVALTEQGANTEALFQFSESLPALLNRAREMANDNDASFVNVYRFRIIVEGYLELLARLHATGQVIAGVDIVGDSFKLADIARNSAVQRAVTSSAARANLPDPQLAQLARKEQDAGNQIQALNKILARLASSPDDKRLQKIIDDMQRDIDKLRQEQLSLRKEILQKFPDYAALIDPQPATPADIQKRLKGDEAVISLYSGERQTYVWTITKNAVNFRAVSIARNDIQRDVAKILASVDLTSDQTKSFEIQTASDLYAKLLAPDAAQWSGATLVNIIPHGALGQLPFALLLTEPIKNAGKSASTSVSYRDMPWLINKVAIAQQSSASGFIALSEANPATKERYPFVGFGNPLFLAGAPPGTQRGKQVRSLSITSEPDETLRILERAQGNDKALDSKALQNRPKLADAFQYLPALPDTADELKEISDTTGGNPSDLYLGSRATESNVKTSDLSRYKILAFATHGLVPGEISGLDQPALALSNPTLTNEPNSDGFLTLEEVLGLKLNADWVILSACNTASADGQASEAVSGLGRAFFYAGTRSLLVSNWAVETISARLLTTGLFKQQTSNQNLSRAEALRRSMMAVMKDKSTDYGHPAFWAPFSLVGDGSGK